MKTNPLTNMMLGLLVAVLAVTSVNPVQADALQAPVVQGGGLSMVPVLGLVSSWFNRNRTYKNAEAFIAARNQDYEDKLKTLDDQLTKGTIYTPQGADSAAQQAAYVKVKALLTQERDTSLAFAESIKKGARRDFNQAAKNQVINMVMSTGFAQNLLGNISQGFGQAQRFVDGALNELQGSGDTASQIRGLKSIASQIQLVGGIIGGQTGADLYNTTQGIIDKVDQQVDFGANDLNAVKADLAAVQSQINALTQRGYFPASSEVTSALAAQLVGLGPGTPETEAILNLLAIRTGRNKQSIRESGLQLLASGQNARCRKILTDLMENLRELQAGTTEESSGSSDSSCVEINPADIQVSNSESTSQAAVTPNATTAGEKPIGFEEADCSATGMSFDTITVNYAIDETYDGPYLICSSSKPGSHDDTVHSYLYAIAYKEDKLAEFYQKEKDNLQGFVTQATEWNAQPDLPADLIDEITFIRNDANAYVFTISYDANVQNCYRGDGYGIEIVNHKYLVKLVYNSCELGSAADYAAEMSKLEEAALTAITRVEAETQH
jgi:hypothetical protein